MKAWIMLFLALTTQTYASDLDATEALTQTLSLKEYSGVSLTGSSCLVKLNSTTRGIQILASSGGKLLSRDVEYGSTYRWQPGQRSFLSSETFATNDGSTENVFRTIAVSEKIQYVVISTRSVTNRASFESKVECIIDL